MDLISIDNIVLEDSHIYYRKVYFADVLYKYDDATLSKKIKFIVESTPLGDKHIKIDFLDPFEQPVLKLMVSIKRFLINLELQGQLP